MDWLLDRIADDGRLRLPVKFTCTYCCSGLVAGSIGTSNRYK